MRRGPGWVIGAAAVLAGAQLLRFAGTNPAVRGEFNAPAAVRTVLHRACFECHSNETRWPWYSRLAVGSWLVVSRVERARRRLNFSEWPDYAYDPGTEARKLEAMAKAIEGGEMPPWYYRAANPDARLRLAEREALLKWITSEQTAVHAREN